MVVVQARQEVSGGCFPKVFYERLENDKNQSLPWLMMKCRELNFLGGEGGLKNMEGRIEYERSRRRDSVARVTSKCLEQLFTSLWHMLLDSNLLFSFGAYVSKIYIVGLLFYHKDFCLSIFGGCSELGKMGSPQRRTVSIHEVWIVWSVSKFNTNPRKNFHGLGIRSGDEPPNSL